MACAITVGAGAVPESFTPVQPVMTASAETFGDLTYEVYDDHIEITGGGEAAKSIDIPAEIDGLPVTSIGKDAFVGYSNLKSITIPDSVTTIGDGAFWYASLESITIPDSVTSIGRGAFDNTPWLEAKIKENPLVIINSILINGNTCEGDVIIPDSVTSIGNWAFGCCENLKSITIPDSVTSIEYGAFWECESLTSITIPNSVTSIGDNSFYRCLSLTSIVIPNSVNSIGNYAFQECKSLESIIIPDSVTSIGEQAFYFCENLKSITIKNPKCEIDNSNRTISKSATIYGYEGSTAQAYAEEYGYKFESLGEYKPAASGDFNGDGKTDAEDVEKMQRALTGKEPITEDMDLNGDGKVDVFDAMILRRKAMKK